MEEMKGNDTEFRTLTTPFNIFSIKCSKLEQNSIPHNVFFSLARTTICDRSSLLKIVSSRYKNFMPLFAAFFDHLICLGKMMTKLRN